MNWRSMLVILGVGLTASVPSGAQSPQFPASWEGIWEFSTTERSCLDGSFITAYADTDTICAGEALSYGDEGFELECTGSLDENSIETSCSGTFELFPGCEVTFTYTISGTKDGDDVSGTERLTIDYVGDCFTLEDECTDYEVVGVRLDPSPGSCGTVPAVPVSWGKLKASYR